MNKLKRQIFREIAIAEELLRLFADDKLQQDVQRWLSPPDPWKNQNIACGSRHTGTAKWFVGGGTLSEWKLSGPSSLLWIHGKREFSGPPFFRKD